MDDYYVHAFPCRVYSDLELESTENPDEQFFNVEIAYTNMYVLSESRYKVYNDTTDHTFPDIPKHKMLQETIESLICDIGEPPMPEDAVPYVAGKIVECAGFMTGGDDNKKLYSMSVKVVITRANEDQSDEEEEDEDQEVEDNNNIDDGFEGVGDQDFGLVPPDYGLVPAATSSIEELETARPVGQEGNCAICFQDFLAAGVVRMPCSHMFHEDCIKTWLHVGNSCPLCRFQMPIDPPPQQK